MKKEKLAFKTILKSMYNKEITTRYRFSLHGNFQFCIPVLVQNKDLGCGLSWLILYYISISMIYVKAKKVCAFPPEY